MAAGGFKTFTTGEVLTAADTNNFLMQGVLVFDDAAARDAAITAPVEGQVVYLKDTNAVLSYDGTSYVGVGGSSPLTTKGDLYTFSTVDARLGVGANDTVLTADSAEATGLKWAAPAGATANFSLLNAGGTAMTGAATITISGISGQAKLLIYVRTASSASASSRLQLRLNTDTTANYAAAGCSIGTGAGADVVVGYNNYLNDTYLDLARMGDTAGAQWRGSILIDGCNNTGLKSIISTASGTGTATNEGNVIMGFYQGSSTISSVSLISSAGNFDAGTLYVYGSAN